MPQVERQALVRVPGSLSDVGAVLAAQFDAHEAQASSTWRAPVRNDPTTTGALMFTLVAAPDAPDHVDVTIDATCDLHVPFFGGVVLALVAAHYERIVDWVVDTLEHELAGGPPVEPPKPVPLLPPVAFSAQQATLLMTAGFAIAVATFGSSIIGQFLSDIAHSFGTTDDGLGVSLAILRIGMLVALFASALADRLGRRTVVLWSLGGLAVASAVSAVSPNLATFTTAQTFARGFSAAVVIAAGIAAVEEAPEGARAYATSILALTGGAGFTLTVILFPLGDLLHWTWRLVFGLSALCVLLNRRIAPALVESRRYERVVTSRIERGRLREVFSKSYAARFWLLAIAAFLTNLLSAPSSQFMNKYLTDDHGFSHSSIVLLRAVTTAVPGFLGLILAGRLTERYGRRPVASVSLALGAGATAVFFLGSGIVIWIASAVAAATLACGFIAIGVLNTELFPTETRGTSNGLVTVVGVVGSALGLIVVGALRDPLGGLGHSLALTTIGTLVAAICVVPFLPESVNRELDEISPSAALERALDEDVDHVVDESRDESRASGSDQERSSPAD
jgi:putative MFS transporter